MKKRMPKIIFLLQRPEAWVNFESTWSSLLSRGDCELTLLTLPYNVLDPTTSRRMASTMRSRLSGLGIDFVEWTPGMELRKGDFDIAIFGHPYDRERPREFWFESIKKLVSKTVYIPYGIFMGAGQKFNRLQFTQPAQSKSNLLVARSDFEMEQFGLNCPTGNGHVKVLGYPRFDSLMKQISPDDLSEIEDFRSGRKMLLWNSHFSFGPEHSQISNFSTFDIVAPEIFQATRERQREFCLLWRPHPSLLPYMVKSGMLNGEDIEDLREELKSIGVLLDLAPDHLPAFHASDALATDTSSFYLEYLAMKKPILSLINPDGEPLTPEATELASHYYLATGPQAVIKFIDDLIAGMCNAPTEDLIQRHIPHLDGLSGWRIANAIAEMAGLEQAPMPYQEPPAVLISASDQKKPTPAPLFTGEQKTPILDAMCLKLIQLRNLKIQDSKWKKKFRKIKRFAKASLTESIKSNIYLMTLIHQVQKKMIKNGN